MLIFAPPPQCVDPYHGGILARVVGRGGTNTTIILIIGAVRGGGGFYFLLPAPRSKRLCRCQTPAIVVFVIMLEVTVADVAVVGLVTLSSITNLSLYLVPTTIGVLEGPPCPPPSWHWRDAGDGTAWARKMIAGIPRIFVNPLPRPLWHL